MRVLLVHAVFYPELAKQLREGALAELNAIGLSYDEVEVPGALEIPQAMLAGFATGMYAAGIALGTVIRGETGHYDIVAKESARALMQLALQTGLPVGNGILTVENDAQAEERANPRKKNKGGEAAAAALQLLRLKSAFAEQAGVTAKPAKKNG